MSKWFSFARLCYEMHLKEMPYLPEWDKLPNEVRSQLADEIERVSRISLKVIVGG